MIRDLLGAVTRAALAGVVVSAFAVSAIDEAPQGGFTEDGSTSTEVAVKPPNIPTWHDRYAARFPGCTDHKRLVDTLLVVRLDAELQRMSFDDAWTRTHNENTADDVWIVGWCE